MALEMTDHERSKYQPINCNPIHFTCNVHAPELRLKNFELGHPLGKGKFGNVYLARDVNSQLFFALKVINKKAVSQEKLNGQVRREIEIQYHMRHPNILRLYGYIEDHKRVFLVLEYAPGGSLLVELQKVGKFTPDRAAKYIYSIAAAVEYCHQKSVVHRDIKLENVLIMGNGELKIADFGYATYEAPPLKMNKVCGTLNYLPPEMTMGVAYDCKVDNWSLGVIAYEALTGKAPFASWTVVQTMENICHGNYIMPVDIPVGAKDLIFKLLNVNPEKRLSLEGVLKHSWILEMRSKELISSMGDTLRLHSK